MRASEERHGLFIRPSRSHTRGSHSLFRRLSLALLIALLVADGLSFPAAAFTTQTWNTTALFNGGTKASTGTQTDTCENVTANALALNNTGNYQGIGMTQGTSTCATGAWGVNPAGLMGSWDQQTLRAGKLKDFGPNNLDMILSGGPLSIQGTYGRAYYYNTHTQLTGTSSFAAVNASVNATAFVAVNWSAAPNPNYQSILFTLSYSVDFRIKNTNQFWIVFYQQIGPDVTVSATSPLSYADNRIHLVAAILRNGFPEVWVDGSKVVQGGSRISFMRTFTGVQCPGAPSNFWNGTIDECALWTRALSPAEAAALTTGGRSSFLSSGSWTSPSVAFTTSPASVTLTFSGGTAANRPSRLRFLSSSGTVVFDTLIPSGLASPIQVPVNLTFNPSVWKVRLDMIGSGSATATMTSILVTLGAAPLFQTSDILFLFGILLLILSVLCFFTDSPELDLLSFFAAMGFAVWSWLYFFGAFNNSVFALIGIGLGAMVMVLTLGKLTGDVSA